MVTAQDLPDWAGGGLTPYNLQQAALSYTLAGGAVQNIIPATLGVAPKLFDGFIHTGLNNFAVIPFATSYSLAGSGVQVLVAAVAGQSVVLYDLSVYSEQLNQPTLTANAAVTPAAGGRVTVLAGTALKYNYIKSISVSYPTLTAATGLALEYDDGTRILQNWNALSGMTFVSTFANEWLPVARGISLANFGPGALSSPVTVTVVYQQFNSQAFTQNVKLQTTANVDLLTYVSGIATAIHKDFQGAILPAGVGIQLRNTDAGQMGQTDRLNFNYAQTATPVGTQAIQIEQTDGTKLFVYKSGQGIAVPLSFRGLALPSGMGLQAHNLAAQTMATPDHFNLNYLTT